MSINLTNEHGATVTYPDDHTVGVDEIGILTVLDATRAPVAIWADGSWRNITIERAVGYPADRITAMESICEDNNDGSPWGGIGDFNAFLRDLYDAAVGR